VSQKRAGILREPANSEGLNKVLKVLSQCPQGIGFTEILKSLSPIPNPRTLQRWIKTLIEKGYIHAEGKTRNRKFYLNQQEFEPIRNKPSKGSSLKLTQEAEEIQAKVSRPIQSRPHVRYHQEFLDSYKPNHTFYLSEPLRQKLHEMGKAQGDRYPAGTYAKQIFDRLLIDLSWNSSRLEGNTYSLLETGRLIDLGQMAEGKDLKETQMILNHKAAIEFLVESAKEIHINRYTISSIHALLSDNLLSDTACGRLRSIPVAIGSSSYTPLNIPQVINDCFDRLILIAKEIEDPFEQSFFLMVHLPYLQPFEDVNKRTSRLAANIPLIKKNLCPLSFIDVSDQVYINGLLGVYELNRIELLRDVFVWAYERSCFMYSSARNTLGEPDAFRMKYRDPIVQMVAKIVRDCMDKLEAVASIRKRAREIIPEEDRDRFIEIVEREIQSLHVESVVRYRLRPSEFEKWQKTWY